jgi:hypothetical protein
MFEIKDRERGWRLSQYFVSVDSRLRIALE